jgi:hypothetical protein
MVCRIEGQLRRTGKGRAHQRNGAEHVGTHEGAPGCDRGAEIVPGYQCDIAIAERGYEAQRIPNCVQNTKSAEVTIVIRVPAGSAPIAPLIGGNHLIPRRR